MWYFTKTVSVTNILGKEDMNYNILVTSAGQRVSLVRAFQQEVKKLNANGKVYTVDINPSLAPACYISDGYQKITHVNHPDYIKELIGICKAKNVKIIVPTIDTELLKLAENKEAFLKEGITPIVSSVSFVEKCRDKRLINEFFVESGIEIPKPIDKQNPSFPLFLKPYNGSLSKGILLIKDKSEWLSNYAKDDKLMCMEYIDPKYNDEFTVDTYYDKNGELKCVVPRKRISVRAGEINKGVTRKNEILECVKSKLSKIEGAVGCLTMQFFLNSATQRIVGIEINPRFGGGYPLSYQANANYPLYILKEYILNEKIDYFEGWENNMLMLRFDDEVIVRNYEE